jgi:hypothetical protein
MLKNRTLTFVTRWASLIGSRGFFLHRPHAAGSRHSASLFARRTRALLLPALFLPLTLQAGSLVITFDDLPLGNPSSDGSREYGSDPVEYYFNGSGKADASAPISSGQALLTNIYNAQYDSYTGWAYSNTTDSGTPGFGNQYSAITGSGHNSAAYGIFYDTFGQGNDIDFTSPLDLSDGGGMFITNTAYTYYAMRDGDAFSKQFGGESGNDPDYFLVRATGVRDGEITGTSEFFLGDYRTQDNTLVSEWAWWNLEELGVIDGIQFTFEGTDEGQFGLNTPVYLAMDDFRGQIIPEPRVGALLLLGLAWLLRRSRSGI